MRNLVERLLAGLADWAGTGGSGSTWPLDPGVLLWSNKNDSSAWVVLHLCHHFAQYGYWLPVGRHMGPDPPIKASTAQAWGFGTYDTNYSSLLLNLVANRFICYPLQY